MEVLTEDEGFQKETFTFDLNLIRGPRYKAYAEIREIKLRKRMIDQTQAQLEEDIDIITQSSKSNKVLLSPPLPPPKRQQRMIKEKQPSPVVNRRSSLVGQSVPNFSAILRKENRKPISPIFEMRTPPPSNSRSVSKLGLNGCGSGGSKSANCAEKRGGMMARKSYANFEELKTLSVGVSPIKRGGGGGGGGGGKVVSGSGVHQNRTILGNSRLYAL